MLKLTDIKKDYKVADSYVHALKGVSLEFRESEFVCILGQSGCGKTTLLNIIGGLDHYTSGDLIIGGKSTTSFKDRDWDVYRNHQIGFIFQSYNLIPHQTVLGNVEIALTITGVSKEERKERAKRALERVGLGAELNKRPNQLSGGQMQRVAIARALVNNPAILLADEPTGALDSETSVQIMELIKEIAGERLVIMVTHNPELAELYATRIVKLKDGLVENDSNPYSAEDPAPSDQLSENESGSVPDGGEQIGKADKSERKGEKERARMGWLTTLALSARNLLTKKARTALTAIAGSIGIISVCLVLALSSGFNAYIKHTEEDMLSYYPVSVTESSYDMATVMTQFTSPKDMPDLSEIGDKVYVDSFLTSLADGMTIRNNISETYLSYIAAMDPSLCGAIQYGYGASITDNMFTNVDTAINDDENNLHTTTRSLSNLKSYYIGVVQRRAAEYGNLVGFADFFGNIVNKMPGTSDFTDQSYGGYVHSQYDVVAGDFPKNANEAVIVVGKNNEISDLTLAQLGLLNEKKFISLFKKGADGTQSLLNEDSVLDFDEVIGKPYTFFYNDSVYHKTSDWETWNPVLSGAGRYPFQYSGQRADGDIVAEEGEGINIQVTGILRLKEGLTYGCLSSGLNLTEATVDQYVQGNLDSQIVKWMKDDAQCSAKLPESAGPYAGTDVYFSPSVNLNEKHFSLVEEANIYITLEKDDVVRSLGGDQSPTSIRFYANDFDSKDAMLEYFDAWNGLCELNGSYNGVTLGTADKITYSDQVGLLMGMMQTMLNAITYVLVAFTAISLVVSSVMIGIITYVSVVERVKEIGVLRSLGARKRDIKNLFNAETFIIGLSAGLFGVVVTYVLSIFINLIMNVLTGIAGLAALSPVAALVMVTVSVVLTLISGLIPASVAAKKDPVIALRTE